MSGSSPPGLHPRVEGLDSEVEQFTSVADQIALGDQDIRRRFANRVVWLFVLSNVFVMAGLGVAFWQDDAQLRDHLIKPTEKVIDSKVVMALLGASTVQLGAVIFTIARALFPSSGADRNAPTHGRDHRP